MNVQYWSCDLIFDTSIWYDQDSIQVRYEIIIDFVKKIYVSILDFSVFSVYCVEWIIIREIIY